MQKFLLASTALVLSAGIAAAEVTVGGDGRMGVVYQENAAGDNEFSFNSRIRISFAASGETDGGLQFGGSIRADNAGTTDVSAELDGDDGVITTTEGGGVNGLDGSVFVSGAFGKLSMGDVNSAAEAAVGDVSGVGYTGIGDFNELTYLQDFATNESVLYEYSIGDATVYASIDQINNDDDIISVGADYTFGTYTFSLAYEDADGVGDHIIGGVSAGFGSITLKAIYGQFDPDGADDQEQYAVSVDFATGPVVVTGFVSDQFEEVVDDLSYGIGASYDLGGGASLKGGVAHDGTAGDDSDIRADFGISMSF